MTMMRPLRLMILHFSQIGLTDGLTFICPFLLEFVFSTLAAPGNASPGEIIGRNFDFDFIARIDADEVHTDLAGDLSHDFMPAGHGRRGNSRSAAASTTTPSTSILSLLGKF